MNRFFRGSTAPLPFWQGGTGLSFVALFWKADGDDGNSICSGDCGAVASAFVSGLKSREGPFVSMGTVLFDTDKINESYKNYEGMCFSV